MDEMYPHLAEEWREGTSLAFQLDYIEKCRWHHVSDVKWYVSHGNGWLDKDFLRVLLDRRHSGRIRESAAECWLMSTVFVGDESTDWMDAPGNATMAVAMILLGDYNTFIRNGAREALYSIGSGSFCRQILKQIENFPKHSNIHIYGRPMLVELIGVLDSVDYDG